MWTHRITFTDGLLTMIICEPQLRLPGMGGALELLGGGQPQRVAYQVQDSLPGRPKVTVGHAPAASQADREPRPRSATWSGSLTRVRGAVEHPSSRVRHTDWELLGEFACQVADMARVCRVGRAYC